VIVAADNDASKPTNIGLTKARAACESTGFSLAYPDSIDSADFSDLHVTQGLSAVQACIDKATPVNSSPTPVNSSENILMQDYSKPLKQGKAALVILKECGLLLGFDQTFAQFRVYKDGKWELIEDLKPLISEWVNKQTCGGEYTDSWFKGTVNLVAANCVKDFSSRTKKHLIPFKNGVYDINKKALLPHAPDYCLTWQIPHDYASNADCPRFKAFLTESVTHDDVVQVLRAYINAAIFGRSYLQRYLQLIGAGGSGKSTFCEIVIGLVGYENHKSSSLQSLEDDKFELATFIDKRIIYFADQAAHAKNPSNLKKLTGGDSLPIRIMHKQTNANYTSDAMVLLTANQDISTTDNSSGLHRRQITVRFDNQPKRDPQLKKELLKEVSGILNWAMELTSEEVEYLLSQENTSETMQKQARDNLVATNPLARFFLDNFEPNEESYVPIGVCKVETEIKDTLDSHGEIRKISKRVIVNQYTHLYPHYVAYCEATGDKPYSLNTFSSRCVDVLRNVLKWKGINHDKTRTGKVIRGVRFKADLSPQDNDVDVQTAAYAPAPVYEYESENPAPAPVYEYESENPAPAPVYEYESENPAPAPVVPHFYESIVHTGDKQEMLKKWHYMTRRLNPEKKQELKRLSEEVYQQAYESEPSEIKRENAGRAAATEYLRVWASSHGVVSQ
jgi:P4 family phage/plasmid primase-like protien